jgi:hypothetical protein
MKHHISLKRILFAAAAVFLLITLTGSPVLAAGIKLSEESECKGEDITISGSSFYPNSEYIIEFPLGWDLDDHTGKTGSDGKFTKRFEVPEAPGHTYRIYVYGHDSSNDNWAGSLLFTILPEVEVSSKYVFTGDQISLSGTGFKGGSYVHVYVNEYDENDASTFKKVNTDTNGSFDSTSYTIPELTGGLHDLIVSDTAGNIWELEIKTGSKITVNENRAAIGETIEISGTGFSRNAPITFYIDDMELQETTEADINGSFKDIQLTIPAISSGEHVLKAKDNRLNTAESDITTLEAIAIEPDTGKPGTTINIIGEGFSSNSIIDLKMTGVNLGSITSDQTGYFETEVTAPNLPAGRYKLLANDGNRYSLANFTILNGVILSSDTGKVGDSVIAAGYGFNSNSSIVIEFDGKDIGSTQSDGGGEFETEFTVPQTSTGKHQIIITDGINPVILDFTTEVFAEISKTSGSVGTDLNVSGSAFKPKTEVTVSFGSTEAASVQTDEKGSFFTSLTVPPCQGGEQKVTISDGASEIDLVFKVETEAPPVPEAASPVDTTKTGLKPVFEWSAVSDPSGVSYRIQIASDEDFSTIVMDKPGIKGTSYALIEKLEPAAGDSPYYWRIKAIDGASNESEWSEPRTFAAGSSSSLIIIIPTAAAVIILAGIFIWYRRR